MGYRLSVFIVIVSCLTASCFESAQCAEPEVSKKEEIRRAVFTGGRELAERLHQGYSGRLELGSLAGLGLTKQLRERLEHQRHLVHTLNPDYPGIHMTPLHAAAMNGRNEAVAYLLGIGAGPSTPSEYGFTPLHLAVRHGHMETAKLLIEGGANINATTVELVGGSVSVFLEAMKKHDFEMIGLLDGLGVNQITRNSHHLHINTAGRLITFSRWARAGEAMDKELAERVKREVDKHPPLWSRDISLADQPTRTLSAFKLGDGYHHTISVVFVLTNAANEALGLTGFVVPPFSMDYTDANIQSEVKKSEEGALVTLNFEKASIKDWSLQVRLKGDKLLQTEE